jgi:hypothetical protein
MSNYDVDVYPAFCLGPVKGLGQDWVVLAAVCVAKEQ